MFKGKTINLLPMTPDQIVNDENLMTQVQGKERKAKTDQDTPRNHLETKHGMLAINSEFYTSRISPSNLDMTYNIYPIWCLSNPHEITFSQENICAAPSFGLLCDGFQVDERRGRLCFQGREDDEDITSIDTYIRDVDYNEELRLISASSVISRGSIVQAAILILQHHQAVDPCMAQLFIKLSRMYAKKLGWQVKHRSCNKIHKGGGPQAMHAMHTHWPMTRTHHA